MNYEEGVKARLSEEGKGDKEIKRNARLGKSEVEVQISQLKADIVKAEAKVDERKEAYEESKYAQPFSLAKVDEAELAMKKAEKELNGLNDDLKSREDLLKELFPDKKGK